MSAYTVNYQSRYQMPSLQQQTEVSIITAAVNIQNEDPATPDHANRLAWANWANKNSSVAIMPFMWPVAMNPAIAASIASDQSGQGVKDSDVQFVVNSILPQAIADFVAKPPPGA